MNVGDIIFDLNEKLVSVGSYVSDLGLALASVLVSAAVIWSIAIGWRKYKEATSKV